MAFAIFGAVAAVRFVDNALSPAVVPRDPSKAVLPPSAFGKTLFCNRAVASACALQAANQFAFTVAWIPSDNVAVSWLYGAGDGPVIQELYTTELDVTLVSNAPAKSVVRQTDRLFLGKTAYAIGGEGLTDPRSIAEVEWAKDGVRYDMTISFAESDVPVSTETIRQLIRRIKYANGADGWAGRSQP